MSQIEHLITEYQEEAEAMKNVAKNSDSPVNKAKYNTASEYCTRFVSELKDINDDYKRVLGQLLHHLGVEIESKSINIHASKKEQGLALNYIGQILKGCHDEKEKVNEIESILNVNLNKTHILEIAQELLCHDWKKRIELIGKR